MISKLWQVILANAAIAAATIALPAAASAATLYVSEHPSAPGKNCEHAGFKEVQTAIDEAETVPGTTVKICGGTYKEQLEINGPVSIVGESNAKITLPATIKDAATTCDHTVDTLDPSEPTQDLVSICTSGTVKIKSLTLEAQLQACYDQFYNTMVGGGATLEASKDVFQYAGVTKSNPCVGDQGGVGIEVGVSGADSGFTEPEAVASLTTPAVEVGHAVLIGDTIAEYQKNGITVDGDGSSATIGGSGAKQVTITGDGPVDQGQNGIQVSRGAVATIDNAAISNDECTASGCGHATSSELAEDGAGVLLFLPGEAAETTIKKSTLTANSIGVEYISGSEKRPAAPEASLTLNTVTGGYVSVQINQGKLAMAKNKFTGGLVALDVNEEKYGGGYGTSTEYAPEATSTRDYLEGGEASVLVEPDIGALTGELTLTGDGIVGPVENTSHSGFKITG